MIQQQVAIYFVTLSIERRNGPSTRSVWRRLSASH